MRKFEAKIKIGTKVLIAGSVGWKIIINIDPTRQWVQLKNMSGSFQRNHISQYSNKPGLFILKCNA